MYHSVPASPTGVTAVRLNSTHMNVSWKRLTLIEARGFIVSYTVLYQRIAGDRKRQINNLLVPGNESSALIGDLNLSSAYQVFVRASTSAGDGPYTNPPVTVQSMPLAITF